MRFNLESAWFPQQESAKDSTAPSPKKSCDKLHQFNPAVAATHGLHAAVIYQHLAWHCRRAGKWAGRMKSLMVIFPYLSRYELRMALQRLLGKQGHTRLVSKKPEGKHNIYALVKRVRGGKLHTFDPKMAASYGILPAVVYDNVVYWIKEDDAAGEEEPTHYVSPAEWQKTHPYATLRSIERAFQVLRDAGELIVVGKKDWTPVWTMPLGLGKLDRWLALHRPIRDENANDPAPLVRMPEPVLED